MTRHHIEIKTEGLVGQLLIDGHDIARAVAGLTYSVRAGELPRLQVDLRQAPSSEIAGTEADVLLDSHAIEALKLLGWTPPEEEAE
ncbi:hypothetical protein ABT076_10565 [Streptomyces sp. NPDC002131]|uniref:hypothetical protein n=1 Tax=Streptomyces sp. NPDC002131 TaxID=3154535 RepID=UPI00331EB31F